MISFLILVPTLNSYRFLPTLVESIQAQTFDCWRVLFIDGGSGEEHCRMLNQFCRQDARFQWVKQLPTYKGIYGAMNQGLQIADVSEEWVLFWGSDDIAAGPEVLTNLFTHLSNEINAGVESDLYVCKGLYFRMDEYRMSGISGGKKRRISEFKWRKSFRNSLFWGSTPPHQGTIFGPKARRVVQSFDTDFRLAADLDYFLRISSFPQIRVGVIDLILVLMGDCGVSGQQTWRRLSEVIRAYRKAFGYRWLMPFLLRYFQRLQSILEVTP